MDTYGLGAAKYQLQLKYSPSSTETKSRTINAINAPATGVDNAFVTMLRAFFVKGYSLAAGNLEVTNFVESRPLVLA